MRIPWTLLLLLNALVRDSSAFDAVARWGQAVVIVNDVLYVYGGKTDEFNSFSYTSAPNTNDVLYLSLSSSFPASSPPWIVASGASNSSTSQGPALAWHTASAFNTSQILIFGGIPDANSDIVLVSEPDSASILDIWQRTSAIWSIQPSAWAGQPTRRIRHSTATIPTGLVFIFGGERADGSGTAFPDSYVFNPNTPSFTPLPTENGPPDLVGHVSIPLPDGRILVFGGYVPSQGILLLLSTIYVLDTTRTPYTWSRLSVSSGALPNARRAFAAALISSTRILIHGGSDAQLQTTLDDGWVLDLSQPQAVWTRVDSLTSIGARRDHFAVPSGDNVIFGFGYTQSSPAPAPIQIYDVPGSTIVPTFTPRSPTSTPAQTLPLPTNTGSHPSSSMSTTGPIILPTPTGAPPESPTHADSARARTTAIAVSTAFGVLALLALALGALWYRRRKQRKWEERRFWVIDNDDDDGRPLGDDDDDDHDSRMHRNIPMAGHKEDAQPADSSSSPNWLHGLGIAALFRGSKGIKSQNPRETRERRNMLDDEDAADFGTWYNTKGRESVMGSSWSLKSILGGRKNRDSQISTSSTPWREKSDPFADGSSFRQQEEDSAGYGGVGARPRNRRELSYTSTRSRLSYTDPFSDPIQEEPREPSETAYMMDEDPNAIRLVPSLPPLANLRTNLPLDFTAHSLSPLTERTSQSTLAVQESSRSSLGALGEPPSSESATTPYGSVASRHASSTSHHNESPRSPTLLSSLLPAPASEASVRRSDSWWTRLARRASSASTRSNYVGGSSSSGGFREMRDPNSPPVAMASTRLVTIDEKTTPEKEGSGDNSRQSSLGSKGQGQSQGSGSTGSRQQPYVGKHGKSMSSLRTADSDAIERMERTMEVVQRLGTDGTAEYGLLDDTLSTEEGGLGLVVMSPVDIGTQEGPVSDYRRHVVGDSEDEYRSVALQAPVPVPAAPISAGVLGTARSTSRTSNSSTPPSTSGSPRSRPASGSGSCPSTGGGGLRSAPPTGAVAFARAQLEGRRTTVGGPRPPSSARFTVDYGLVPRRSLFIANPDSRRMSGSEE